MRMAGGPVLVATFNVLMCAGFLVSSISADHQQGAVWENHGNGLTNQRYAATEEKISRANVQNLKLKWSVLTDSDVTSTPSVEGQFVYTSTWDGSVFAVNTYTGSVVWKQNLTEASGLTPGVLGLPVLCRHTPVVADEFLLLGIYMPGYVVALNRFTGAFVWSSLLDSHPFALVTMSGTVFQGGYYVGTASLEETRTTGCCSYQGRFMKLDVKTGKILWQTAMLPDNQGATGGYAGSAVWGSSPSIDPSRNTVFIATGNLYSSPPDVVECEKEQLNKTVRDIPDPCIRKTDHSESVLALDLDTGAIVWASHLGAYDTWVFACVSTGNPNCPTIPGPDYDFGQAPMLLRNVEVLSSTHASGKTCVDILVVAQKSGFVYGLRADNGSTIWTTVAGPGGYLGGSMWGSASDGNTIYTAITNTFHQTYTLLPSNKTTTGGAWVALEATTGNILWSTPSPDVTAPPYGPVSVANHVVFATARRTHGAFYALDAISGSILWSDAKNGSVAGGFSIVNGCIYVGEGITISGGQTHGKYLYSYCL